MSYTDAMIVDLLGELDMDIQGFIEVQSEPSSLLFATEVNSWPSTSAEADVELQPFEPINEIYMSPRKWIAAGPPLYNNVPAPVEVQQVSRALQTLTVQVPPRSPSYTRFRRLPSPTTPTECAFARLRATGSNLALRALSSPEIRHRVLI
ncbi:hypothetical protein B0H12DRAFT_584305 [Mycena haematopus]|nr:hypothetical protein B0H12DRAFT_584305 [Mycena haematopus]